MRIKVSEDVEHHPKQDIPTRFFSLRKLSFRRTWQWILVCIRSLRVALWQRLARYDV